MLQCFRQFVEVRISFCNSNQSFRFDLNTQSLTFWADTNVVHYSEQNLLNNLLTHFQRLILVVVALTNFINNINVCEINETESLVWFDDGPRMIRGSLIVMDAFDRERKVFYNILKCTDVFPLDNWYTCVLCNMDIYDVLGYWKLYLIYCTILPKFWCTWRTFSLCAFILT